MGLSGTCPTSWYEATFFFPSRVQTVIGSSLEMFSSLFLHVIASNMPVHMHRKVFPNLLLQESPCQEQLQAWTQQLARITLWPHRAASQPPMHTFLECAIIQNIYELPICSGRAAWRSRPAWFLIHCSHQNLNPLLWPGWHIII